MKTNITLKERYSQIAYGYYYAGEDPKPASVIKDLIKEMWAEFIGNTICKLLCHDFSDHDGICKRCGFQPSDYRMG